MIQFAEPYKIYHHPNSPEIADFFNKGEFGIATGVDHEAPEYRSKYAVSSRQNFATDSMRNAGITVNQSNNDIIKDSYQMYPNERDVTTLRTYDSNISKEVPDSTLGLMDGVRKTIKQTTIDSKNNGYISGGMDMPTERLYDEIKNCQFEFSLSLMLLNLLYKIFPVFIL